MSHYSVLLTVEAYTVNAISNSNQNGSPTRTKQKKNPKNQGSEDRTGRITGDMRRVLDFGGNASGRIGGIGDKLLDEEDESEAALSELTYDLETVLVDPDITGAIDGVVQSIQSGKRAPHHSLSLSITMQREYTA